MTMITQPVTGSAAFWEQFDPVTQLKTNVKAALANGDLMLTFMVSRPPTREECEMGLQVLKANSDDLPFTDLHTYHWTYNMAHNTPVGLSHRLVAADWANLHDVIAAQNNTAATENPTDLLSLVPATALSNGAQWYFAQGQDTAWERGGQVRGSNNSADDVKPTPYRWALLTTYSMFQALERTWAVGAYKDPNTHEPDRVYDTCIFDFRGGIPLSVGTHSSNANIWLGHMEAELHTPPSNHTGYRASRQLGVNVARLHVPVPTMV